MFITLVPLILIIVGVALSFMPFLYEASIYFVFLPGLLIMAGIIFAIVLMIMHKHFEWIPFVAILAGIILFFAVFLLRGIAGG